MPNVYVSEANGTVGRGHVDAPDFVRTAMLHVRCPGFPETRVAFDEVRKKCA
ncbi:hypothetical protein SCP_1001270 [Sparassis crispa]|uniref:Uncharacterized protein n=1 Tax=Sparassis crispa TaxID=139825 RepID=A0A401GXG6_9APHY|nr:hypothetical protein SCP_1001270 [Sparassis crispa]GBE86883.1 hypothetical protein SCP_1001270 [Sparassis crispa]